jgi:hypothetical protein
MRRQVGLAEEATTMLSYLIVAGLCLLLVLHIVCKVWQNALEIHSAADNLDKTRDLQHEDSKRLTTAGATPQGQVGWILAPEMLPCLATRR